MATTTASASPPKNTSRRAVGRIEHDLPLPSLLRGRRPVSAGLDDAESQKSLPAAIPATSPSEMKHRIDGEGCARAEQSAIAH
jgi:hypothetical protein